MTSLDRDMTLGELALRLEGLDARNADLERVVIRQAEQLQDYTGKLRRYETKNGLELHTLNCTCGRCEEYSASAKREHIRRDVARGATDRKVS